MRKLKIYREQKGLTQIDLAKAIGIAQSEISAYESGAKSPKLSVAVAIAAVLGVTIGELVGE